MFEVVAVVKLPNNVKEILKSNYLNENIITGLLTLERANLVSDTITSILRKTKAFII